MATYYIATTGNDTSGNGSLATPWLTFAKFLSSSATGDTCIARAGSYTWASATVNHNLQAYTGEKVYFNAAAGNVAWTFGSLYSGTITNINFHNAVCNSGVEVFSIGAANLTNSFVGCSFYNIAFGTSGTSTGSHLFKQVITAVATNTVTFLKCKMYDLKRQSSSHDNSIFGSHMNGTNTYLWRINIYNTTVDATQATTNLQVTTIEESYTYGAVAGAAGRIWDIKNSIFYADSVAVSFTGGYAGYSTFQVNNCDFYNVTTAGLTPINSLTSDPLFVDRQGSNFNLRPLSPCRGTGVSI